MNNIRSLSHALLCLCLAALAPSCSLKQRTAEPVAPAVTAVPVVPVEREQDIIDDTTRQAQAHMALGNYKKALEVYGGAYDKHQYPGLRSGFARTAEQIRVAADGAYQKKNFAESGSIYHTLSESGITARDFAQTLSFDNEYLNRQVGSCSKALMESGLMKYREGKLDEAISVWGKALAFDPENKGIRNALETATTQLQKLKSMK